MPAFQLSPESFAALADHLLESLSSVAQQNDAYYAENWLKVFRRYAFQTTKRKKDSNPQTLTLLTPCISSINEIQLSTT